MSDTPNREDIQWEIIAYLIWDKDAFYKYHLRAEYFDKQQGQVFAYIKKRLSAGFNSEPTDLLKDVMFKFQSIASKRFLNKHCDTISDFNSFVKQMLEEWSVSKAWRNRGHDDFLDQTLEDLRQVKADMSVHILPHKFDPMEKYSNFRHQALEGRHKIEVDYDFVNDKCPLTRGGLWTLGARTNMGKTAFAVGLALQAAKRKYKTLFVSLEMPVYQVVQRMYALITDEPVGIFTNPTDSDEDMKLVAKAELMFERDYCEHLMILDRALSPEDLNNLLDSSQEKFDFVVVDYIQIMKTEIKGKKWEQVSHISKSLKRIAIEHDVAVLGMTQLNTGAEGDDDPGINSITGSSELANDSDVVCFLTREHRTASEAKLSIKKNRHGLSGIDGHFRYQLDTLRFVAGGVPKALTRQDISKTFKI